MSHPNEPTPMSPEQRRRYDDAVHSMQCAMGFELEHEWKGTARDAKHLRVGINNALADQAALAQLLMSKGVISGEEYNDAIVDGAEREAARAAIAVRARFGLPDSVEFR
jgi:hypothetical protein